jgi:hypothetical protein
MKNISEKHSVVISIDKHSFSLNLKGSDDGVDGLCPSSEVLNTIKHNISETGCVSVLR